MIALSPAPVSANGHCDFGVHEQMKADPATWESLPCIGHQDMPADGDDPAERIELRNCNRPNCNGTMAKVVPL